MAERECKRCGMCCQDVGRTFWKVGDYRQWPQLEAIARNGDHEDNGEPCEMLRFVDGQAVCQIEEYYGREAKPRVCRMYPFEDPCGWSSMMCVRQLIEADNDAALVNC